MASASAKVRSLINGIIEREGGYVDHPNDPGGATMYGITEAVARVNGYTGDMRHMPRSLAERIYLEQYFIRPQFNRVSDLSEAIAEEMTDTGVNMGTAKAATYLQVALNAFNLNGKFYRDIAVDGGVGNETLAALGAYLDKRGAEGETVMLKALNCLQGADYIALATSRPEKFETFVYGWLLNRVAV